MPGWPEDGFKLLANPIKGPGGYSLHLYCKYENSMHAFDEFPHEYEQWQTYQQAAKQAKAGGWMLHRDGTATCPKCVERLKRGDKPLTA